MLSLNNTTLYSPVNPLQGGIEPRIPLPPHFTGCEVDYRGCYEQEQQAGNQPLPHLIVLQQPP